MRNQCPELPPMKPCPVPTAEEFKFFESLVGKKFVVSNNSDHLALRGRSVIVMKYLGDFLFEVKLASSRKDHKEFWIVNHVDLVVKEIGCIEEMRQGVVHRAVKLVEVETHLVTINGTVFEIENAEMAESGSVITPFTGTIKSVEAIDDNDKFIKTMKDNKREFPW